MRFLIVEFSYTHLRITTTPVNTLIPFRGLVITNILIFIFNNANKLDHNTTIK